MHSTLAILIVLSFGISQNVKPPSEPAKERDKIQTTYDRFKDVSTVQLKHSLGIFDPFGFPSMHMTAVSWFSGTTPSVPDRVKLVIFSEDSAWNYRREGDRGIIAILDGKRKDLGFMDYVGFSGPNGSGHHIVEELSLTLSLDTFLQIANADKIEVQIGRREVLLKREHVNTLRYYASHITSQK